MKLIIDRFEGTLAVCEDDHKNKVNIPKYRLPLEAQEGDTIVEEDGIYHIDDEETRRRRQEMKDLVNRLFE